VVVPDRASSNSIDAKAVAAPVATVDSEALEDHVKKKGKEKMIYKKKELVSLGCGVCRSR
jgi:hypothetical protein